MEWLLLIWFIGGLFALSFSKPSQVRNLPQHSLGDYNSHLAFLEMHGVPVDPSEYQWSDNWLATFKENNINPNGPITAMDLKKIFDNRKNHQGTTE